MKKLIFILLLAGTCFGQSKITVIFNDITNAKVDTVFFQVDSFTSDCQSMDGSSLHVIPGPKFNSHNSGVDNKMYLPVYDISWERNPIMGDIVTWSDYNNNFQCTALYLFDRKDLYLSK